MLETVLTGVTDQYPELRKQKTWVIMCICIVFFIIGLPLTCPVSIIYIQMSECNTTVNPVYGEVYSIQHYVIKFVSNLG
jgi:hypothetical protein